jgi:hypothetical protein
MGIIEWFQDRAEDVGEAFANNGRRTYVDPNRATKPPSNVGPGGMIFEDDDAGRARAANAPKLTEQQLIDAGLIAGPWITADPNGGGGGGGFNAAAYVQSLIDGIEESYNRQRGQLDTNKAASAAGIQKNYDAFKQGVANNQALYQQGSAAIQAEITRRMAESAARNAETGSQVAAAVGGIGGSASAANAQAAANQASLASSQGFQQDLANRLDQIVGANQRSVENSGDLVRQGASGNLENSYNAMLNALLANREQSIVQAQQAGMSGGGGGGSSSGGTDYTKMNKQANDKTRYEWGLNNYTPSIDEMIQLMLRGGGSDAAAAMAYLASQGQQNSNQGS